MGTLDLLRGLIHVSSNLQLRKWYSKTENVKKQDDTIFLPCKDMTFLLYIYLVMDYTKPCKHISII